MIQLEEKLKAGPAWTDRDLVFSSTVGGHLHTSLFLRTVQEVAERSRLTGHSLSRSASQSCHNVAEPGGASQGGAGNLGAQPDQYDDGHLLPRAADHAAGGYEETQRRSWRVSFLFCCQRCA